MTNSEDNIRKLMEMLDNPDAYSEQEIRDIIGQDEETQETYRMMVEIKRSSRRSQNDAPVDVDAAWKRFEQTHYQRRHSNAWMRVAAGFIGLLFVSGISFAAISAVKHHNERKQAEQQTRQETVITTNAAAVESEESADQLVVFTNTKLEQMLTEIASYYGVTVEYKSADVRDLRFYYEWNRKVGIESVTDDLNRFAKVNITLNNKKITVE
ncbi:MAG: DUF4974 domain-containing protein [Bacteroidaceae bacterium]|nr:DUF4974 domain-containing protein [Bacteroidaceae bacterium]